MTKPGSKNSNRDTPLVLDLDRSLQELTSPTRIALTEWQEAIRFGCSWSTWEKFRRALQAQLPSVHGTVCMGSGDFHHVTHLLLERCVLSQPFDVVVFDNHPDNMRFPFGIHCGSWVVHAARLPHVRCVHVLGITSSDVAWQHAWENHLWPLYQGKIRYWTTGVKVDWARRCRLTKQIATFNDPQTLVDQFILEWKQRQPGGVYVSIDKDVFSLEVGRTNWDQGGFDLPHAKQILEALQGDVIGSDITGEVSEYRYRTGWKRWLSSLDRQPAIPTESLTTWQSQQVVLNRQLLTWLAAVSR